MKTYISRIEFSGTDGWYATKVGYAMLHAMAESVPFFYFDFKIRIIISIKDIYGVLPRYLHLVPQKKAYQNRRGKKDKTPKKQKHEAQKRLASPRLPPPKTPAKIQKKGEPRGFSSHAGTLARLAGLAHANSKLFPRLKSALARKIFLQDVGLKKGSGRENGKRGGGLGKG